MTAANKVFESMLGVTMASVTADDDMVFAAEDGRRFVFYYEPDCCASCSIDDICGDLADLEGAPLTEAEEVTDYEGPVPEVHDSYTWTFYKFATCKGCVTVRWYGESNGYYSESVSFREEPAPSAAGTRWGGELIRAVKVHADKMSERK